mmetsp:Transcript_11275/g.43505  ORF Transcript_11275/g.43505 Transcript_11275/m.43505 type:complete len:232 (-) Transcript_11275:369-1064(-)
MPPAEGFAALHACPARNRRRTDAPSRPRTLTPNAASSTSISASTSASAFEPAPCPCPSTDTTVPAYHRPSPSNTASTADPTGGADRSAKPSAEEVLGSAAPSAAAALPAELPRTGQSLTPAQPDPSESRASSPAASTWLLRADHAAVAAADETAGRAPAGPCKPAAAASSARLPGTTTTGTCADVLPSAGGCSGSMGGGARARHCSSQASPSCSAAALDPSNGSAQSGSAS